MRLLILTNNYEGYPPFTVLYYLITALVDAFPGSRVYGPGFPDYAVNDVEAILEQLGGADKFDAIFCMSVERPLLGEPVHSAITENYTDLPVGMWRFPENLGKVRLPKIFFPIDMWHCTPNEWARILTECGFSYVYSLMIPPFASQEDFQMLFPEEILKRVVFIPSGPFVEPSRFKDFGLEKKYDVMMAGTQLPHFYPVRAKMQEAFRNSGLKLFEPTHPGYVRLLKRNHYPQQLNSSSISAFCNGRFHVAAMKLVEAMACRCAALCDFFYGAEHLGMLPGTHFVLADETNCVEAAKELLREPERLQAMYDAAQRLVLEQHTTQKRASDMAQWLPALLNHEKGIGWAQLSPNLPAVKARNRMAKYFVLPPEDCSSAHVLDEALECEKSTWRYWHYMGSVRAPAQQDCAKRELYYPFYVQHLASSWVQIFQAEYLKKLARDIQAVNFLEIGTGLGFQSFVWAGWLLSSQREGKIVTLDTVGHDEMCMGNSVFLMERKFVRRKLWEGWEESSRIQFIHRGQEAIPASTPFDLVFIDRDNTFDSVLTDFGEIEPLLHPDSVIVVNRYCDSHPGVVDAVHLKAKENGLRVKRISFSPEPEALAVCRFKQRPESL